MDFLEEFWEKLNLMEEEDVAIIIEESATLAVQKKGELCLVGKIWNNCAISKAVI